MKKNNLILSFFLFLLLISNYSFTQYTSNPFIFSIQDAPVDGCFFVYDVNGDNKLDYIFRSEEALYVYSHNGNLLWKKEISMIFTFEVNAGNKCCAADIDGDGEVEIVALNDKNEIIIYNGKTGTKENSFNISVDDTTQVTANIVLVNQRYPGSPQKKRDVIIQTNGREGIDDYWKKINRTLIALNLETGEEIWRVQQDGDVSDRIYEGYFGQAHGGPVCADIDLDGIDEIIGGNVIDYNSGDLDIIDPGNYKYLWERWVRVNTKNKFIDHIDAVSVGDFRPDIPGLEWIITEEDHNDGPKDVNSWHTIMFSKNSIIWRKETELFNDGSGREPQNTCAGNFDNSHDFCEVWNRSRFSTYNESGEVIEQAIGQHPWVYDAFGNQIADYSMEEVLPADFNPAGNGEGIDEVWTIDWSGGEKEYIVGMARHTNKIGIPGGNVVILNAVTGEVVWSTLDDDPQIQASLLYVADIYGDSREEIIICDVSNNENRIKVYTNESKNQNSGTDKWRDPLYVQVKQSWNYYSPGSYTKGGFPSIFNVQIKDVNPTSVVISWYTNEPCDSRVKYGFTEDYDQGSVHTSSYVTEHEVQLTGLEPETDYHYRIISENSEADSIISPDNVFSTAQSVILLYPQGGETFYLDSLVTISWRIPSGQYGVMVDISRDSGKTWESLSAQAVNDSTFSWMVDEPPSHDCFIRVRDEDDNLSDVTEEQFMILDTTKHLFFNPREQCLELNKISNTVTVQVQNSSGKVVGLEYDYNLFLQTTSPTGEFSLDSASWNPVSQVSIDSGSCSALFFYKDNSLGNSEIIVSEDPPVGWENDTLKNLIVLENNDFIPPKLNYFYPYPGKKLVPVNNAVQFKIVDPEAGSGVDISSLKVSINNIKANESYISKIGKNYLVDYIPEDIGQNKWVSIKVQCKDSVINKLDTTYTYLTGNTSIIDSCKRIVYPGGRTIINETNRVRVDFPQGAIGDTLYFTIGETDTVPPLPDSAVVIGKYYYLGPPGLQLNKKITVTLPCNENILNQAGVTGVDQLPVYFNNFDSWSTLSVESYSDSQVTVKTNSTGYLTFCKASSTQITEWLQDESTKHKWKLRQNYPNPFNPNTSIRYYLTEKCFVNIKVFDLLGRFIKELVAERQNAGFHSVEWNGTDFEGRNLPSGIYLLQMEVNDYTEMRKMILRR
ncbi:MAG: FG-GAP-like repeat-containing protein [bacterium]